MSANMLMLLFCLIGFVLIGFESVVLMLLILPRTVSFLTGKVIAIFLQNKPVSEMDFAKESSIVELRTVIRIVISVLKHWYLAILGVIVLIISLFYWNTWTGDIFIMIGIYLVSVKTLSDIIGNIYHWKARKRELFSANFSLVYALGMQIITDIYANQLEYYLHSIGDYTQKAVGAAIMPPIIFSMALIIYFGMVHWRYTR